MSDEKTDVLVAGYQDISAATEDFESLVGQVKDGKVEIEGWRSSRRSGARG
jgi:hypothetical protein